MGKIVLGLAAPHNPNITSRPGSMTDEQKHQLFSSFDRLRRSLSEASPDALLILTTDHMTNFFYHNNPMFCLAVSDTCTGPAPKEIPELCVPRSTLKVDTSLAKGLLHFGIEHEIDFSYSEEMVLDHAYMVPLSFVTPQMDLPIVPLHIGSLLPPSPTARRCYKIGQQIGEFVRNHYDGKVAVLASGSIYSDVGGPTMGAVDTRFDMEFLDLVKNADAEQIVHKATHQYLEKAGVANDIRAWITLLGVLGPIQPSFTDYVWGSGWASGAASLVIWNPNS